MNAIKLTAILVVTALIIACTPSGTNGAKFVGDWHTAPLSNMVTKQLFLKIKPVNGDNYSVDSHWVSSFGRKEVSSTQTNTYILTNGALIGPMGVAMSVDDQGVLRFAGSEYRK